MKGNPDPNPVVSLINYNGENLPSDLTNIKKGVPLQKEGDLFKLRTNTSMETMIVVCEGANELGSVQKYRTLYVHGIINDVLL